MYRFTLQTRHLIDNVSVKDCGYHVSTVEVGECVYHLCVFEVVCGRSRYARPVYVSYSDSETTALARHEGVDGYVRNHLHLEPETLEMALAAATSPSMLDLAEIAGDRASMSVQ